MEFSKQYKCVRRSLVDTCMYVGVIPVTHCVRILWLYCMCVAESLNTSISKVYSDGWGDLEIKMRNLSRDYLL